MNSGDMSNLNPLGLIVLMGVGIFTFFLPRRYALLPVIVITCFMTMGQMVVVSGLHFTMMRIMVLFGWVRILCRRELRPIRLNKIDKALIAWTVVAIISHTLLWQTWGEFVNRLGFGYNSVGMYFLFRVLLRDIDDIKRVFAMTAIVIIPLALAMLVEYETRRNMFAIFGGVRAVTELRGGSLRCQGPFAHPILSGTFGASLLPFFLSLWWQKGKYRLLSISGMMCSAIITVTSGSSGPVMAFMAGALGTFMWVFRTHMRVIRWMILLGFIGLAIVMKAPVWYIIQRINVFSASTGDHRALLIDQFVHHFSDWWLVGVRSTVGWADENMWDITNQYIWEAVNGGLATMLLFIALITRAFGGVGQAVRKLRGYRKDDDRLLWALGATLFAHTLSFISISYFDQNILNFYLLLAMIATALSYRPKNAPFGEREGKAQVVAPELVLATN
jgi:hypothetical protein